MKKVVFGLIVLVWLLAGCRTEADPTPTAVPPTATPAAEETAVPETTEPAPAPSASTDIPAGVRISEMLAGISGNNNYDFVELYNGGTEPVDLAGWSLWYQLTPDRNPEPVYRWEAGALLPGRGHYLLVHEGEDVGAAADAVFTLPLFAKGGLLLRDGDNQTVDLFGWGDAPEKVVEGRPAAVPEAGMSLERQPGGEAGNWQATGDNSSDIVVQPVPNPQNSGSDPTPLADQLAITLTTPETLTPGEEFAYELAVSNQTAVSATNLTLSLPIANHFRVLRMDDGGELTDGRLSWQLDELGAGETAVRTVTLQAPLTYVDTQIGGVFVAADGLITRFAPPLRQKMAGGSIPIATARQLPVGSLVTVEGVATMYTGGYFAGTTSTKFYLQDDTGGVQVFVPGGARDVVVRLGDRLRVTGEIELFRDAVEVIPRDFTADIERVGEGEPLPEPTLTTAAAHAEDALAMGRLNVVAGTAVRIEEFTFSYEVDLLDDGGNIVEVYVDKLTEATTETMDLGKQYRVVGVSEIDSGQRQLKPRVQADLAEIFPPVLLLTQTAVPSAQPGAEIIYTLTAANHTDAPLTNVAITAVLPQGATLGTINSDGTLDGDRIGWTVAELPNGESVTVSYTATVTAADVVVAGAAIATADQWPEAAASEPYQTFVGDGVPVWAVQGSGVQSPYRNTELTTVGVVTAVFPDLGGFWLQELLGDGDTATSDGLFVLAAAPVAEGDAVQVTGKVRELAQQTTLDAAAENIAILSSNNGLPSFVAYDPPTDPTEAAVYKEALEGMLVAVEETAVVIAPTTRFGEYALVRQTVGVDTVRRTDDVGFVIFVDDGSSVAHEDQSTLPYAVKKGDTVSQLFGPLAFTFGQYKIEPLLPPQIGVAERPLPSLPLTDQLTIATFNVENLFDNRDPHPSDPPRPTRSQYDQKLTKLAEAIVAMGAPTVMGLQEVENIGILEQLVTLEQLAPFGYQPYLIEGEDSRGIDVAFLVRGDQATVGQVANFPMPDGSLSRPPLLLELTFNATGEQLFLINNHLTSLSAGEEATEPLRTAQAAWVASVLEEVRAENPEAGFVVLGDLNSFVATPPIETLQAAGLRHAYEFFDDPAAIPYTYIFEGATQSLDHILLSDGLFARLVQVTTLPIDADYPLADPADPSPLRVSDHDPLVVIIGGEG
ncbi:MAG: lamin tail domain-containing protein [Chloroflexota bacterium]